MDDVAFATTVAGFALVAFIAKGVAELWLPGASSVWWWPSSWSVFGTPAGNPGVHAGGEGIARLL
ncbi:hypothetical protein [Streptomyces sp. NPDC054887]